MLKGIKLVFQVAIAKLFGWYLCVLEGTERQCKLLLKLSDPERGKSMELADCFLRDDGQDVSTTFMSLDRWREIPPVLRKAPEVLFWIKPGPECLILKHAVSGKENYFPKEYFSRDVDDSDRCDSDGYENDEG
jgi:hypothetical protein